MFTIIIVLISYTIACIGSDCRIIPYSALEFLIKFGVVEIIFEAGVVKIYGRKE